MKTLLLGLLATLSLMAAAEPPLPAAGGEVRVPLDVYTKLMGEAHREDPRAPAAYAIGVSQVQVAVTEAGDRTTARVRVELSVEVFEDTWTLVPVLPAGTALAEALIDGRPAPLVQGPEGLSWSTSRAGQVTLTLRFDLDARRSGAGFVLPLPLPRAASTALQLRLPGTGHDLAVVPSEGLRSEEQSGATLVNANIPATSAVLVSWRVPGKQSHAVSRARYRGELRGDALVWHAEYQVELFGAGHTTLALMPSTVALGALTVDGEEATVLEEDGRFVTVLEGQGMHTVALTFQAPVDALQGPPSARLAIPRVPVSHFELTLPGKKEVSVEPRASVETREVDGTTRAAVFVPMGEEVVFSWVDAIPEELKAQVRANASTYHAILAEEGVLHARATVVYEISRGETSQLTLALPHGAQVNRIVSAAGGVSDWAESAEGGAPGKTVDVYLDREVSGRYVLNVDYEILLGDAVRAGEPLALPLLEATGVHRQRGMVALLAGPELNLEPVTETRLTRVGENQIPPFVRNTIENAVSHTFKYTESAPGLTVRPVAPRRRQGKFDARVDTLVSIGEVSLRGAATVEVTVKSGAIMELVLELPEGVNVLGVAGASIRRHEVGAGPGGQHLRVEFTQEMEGQLRLELTYERFLADGSPENDVPTVSVGGAEVEHGRIAVEALSAVEVRATATEQLSSLELNELPQQLVLRTTNPILLAYKYVRAEKPVRLALSVARHPEIDVQVAAIETANYTTLFTRDGLAVTRARYLVRNSRRQFLRLDLPPGSRVWSVFADGRAEKPARADDGEDSSAILIRLINASSGFPVEVVYAGKAPPMGFSGGISERLPRPDIVVTHSRWDVYVPPGPRYRSPESTMDVVVDGKSANPRLAAAIVEGAGAAGDARGAPLGQPLRINVPTRGVHFAFEKLYANQSDEDARFRLPYVSAEGAGTGAVLAVLGTVLVWAAIFGIALRRQRVPRSAAAASLVFGVAMLAVALGPLGASPLTASLLALAIGLLTGVWAVGLWVRDWRARRIAGL